MSATVDSRVVEMQFDNKNFENNVRTSLSTIEKLKQSLNFTGAGKGLSSIEKQSSSLGNVMASNLGGAVEGIGLKFNAMWTIADQTLRNITNRIEHMAVTMAKAVTIDPIKSGFQEYETQINAVQTILANTESKGTTIDDVNAALDELNTYADKTIYNFTQMTRNIGTFTAAGVDLDKSVQSIKGIANLAAVSGSSSQQASIAMYQLSQALAAGRVNLMDWNSVVNAGMGGQLFQEALKRTARNLGTGVDEAIEKYGTFRESLSRGEWLTTEVLTETLAQLSGAYTEAELIAQGYTEAQAAEIVKLSETAVNAATKVKTFTQLIDTTKEALQSGWTQTWELIIGDFEEAKEFWTEISDIFGEIINNSSQNRNDMLSGALTSNWDKLVGSVNDAGVSTEDFTAAVSKSLEKHGYVVEDVIDKYGSLEKAFQSGAISSNILDEALRNLKISAADLSDVNAGLARDDGLGGYSEDVTEVQKALKSLGFDLGQFGENADGVDGIFGAATEQAIRDFQALHGLEVTGIVDQATLDKLNELTNTTSEFKEEWNSLVDGIDKLGGRELLLEGLKNILHIIIDVFGEVGKAWSAIFPPMTSERLYELIEKFHAFTEELKPSETTLKRLRFTFQGLFAVLNIVGMAFGAVWNAIKPIFGGIAGLADGLLLSTAILGGHLTKLRDWIKETGFFDTALAGVSETIKLFVESFTAFVGSIDFESVIGSTVEIIKSLASVVKGFIDGLDLPTLDEFKTKIEEIIQAVKDFFANDDDGESKFSFFETLNEKLASIAIKAQEFGTALGEAVRSIGSGIAGSSIVTFFQGLWEAIKGIGGFIGSTVGNVFSDIGEFFGGIGEGLSNIDFSGISEFINSLTGGGLMLALHKILGMGKVGFFAEFLDEIGDKVRDIAASFQVFLGSIQNVVKVETIKKMALAIGILAVALLVLSAIEPERLSTALVAITGLFVELIAATKAFSVVSPNLDLAGVAPFMLFAIAIANGLLILSKALKNLDGMNMESVEAGLVGIAGMATVLLAAAYLMEDVGGGSMKAALNMVIYAAAINIMGSALQKFVPTVQAFADIDGDGLGRSVGAMVAIIAAISLFAYASKGSRMLSASAGLLIMGIALQQFIPVMHTFSQVDWPSLLQGLGALTVLIVALSIFAATTRKSRMITAAASLYIMGEALQTFLPIIHTFSQIDQDELIQGTAGLATLIVTLSIFAASTRKSRMLTASASLFVLAKALTAFFPVIHTLGRADVPTLFQGLGTIAASLIIFAVGLNAMTGTLSGSASLLVAAIAVNALAVAMTVMGTIGLPGLIVSLLSLAAVFGVLFVAGMALGPVIPVLMSLSLTMLAIAATVALVGVGFMALGAGLVSLSAGLVGFGGSLAVATVISDIIVGLCVGLGKGIVELCEIIKDGAPVVADAFITLVIETLRALSESMDGLVEYVPPILEGFIDIFTMALYALGDACGGDEGLVAAIGYFLGELIGAITDQLTDINTGKMGEVLKMLGIIAVAGALFGRLKLIGSTLKGIGGLALAVLEIGAILAAFGYIGRIEGVKEIVADGGTFITHVADTLNTVIEAFKDVNFLGFMGLALVLGALNKFTGGMSTYAIAAGEGILGALLALVTGLLYVFGKIATTEGINAIIADGGALLCNVAKTLNTVIDAFSSLNFLGFMGLALVLGALNHYTGSMSTYTIAAGEGILGVLLALVTGLLYVFGKIATAEGINTVISDGGALLCNVARTLNTVIGAFSNVNFLGFMGLALVLGTLNHLTGGMSTYAIAAGEGVLGALLALVTGLLYVFGKIATAEGINTVISDGGALLCNVARTLNTVIGAFANVNFLGFMGLALVLGTLNHLTGGMSTYAIAAGEGILGALLALVTGLLYVFGKIATAEGINTVISDGGALLCNVAKTLNTVIGAFANVNFLGFMGLALVLGTLNHLTGGMSTYAIAAGEGVLGALLALVTGLLYVFGKIATAEGINDVVSDGGTFLCHVAHTLNSVLKAFSSVNFAAFLGLSAVLGALNMITGGLSTVAIAAGEGVLGILLAVVTGLLYVFGQISSIEGVNDVVEDGGAFLVSVAETLGSAIDAFNTTLSKIDIDLITKAGSAISEIQTILEGFIGEDGPLDLIGDLIAMNAFDSFATTMTDIGEGLASFYEPIDGKEETIGYAITMLQNLVDVFNSYTNKSVDTLTTNIDKISSSMSEFATQIGSTDSTNLANAVANVDSLKNMITNLSGLDTSGVIDFTTALTTLGESGVQGFSDAFTTEDAKTTMTTALSNLFGTAISHIVVEVSPRMADSVGTVVDAMLAKLTESEPSFTLQGLILIAKVATGIYDGSVGLVQVVGNAMTKCVLGIKLYHINFYNVGSYLVQGFANGIRDNAWRATARAGDMARDALKAAKNALGIQSPSKEFAKIGEYVTMGLANGISNYSKLATTASSEMATDTVDAAKNILSKLDEVVNADIDAQPVISPVLDLTNVESGARTINSLFGATEASKVGFMMNAQLQNGKNSDVVSAINGLYKRLDNLEKPTYNINGVTYDDGSNIVGAVETLVRAARIDRRS